MKENIPNYFDLLTPDEILAHYDCEPDPAELARDRELMGLCGDCNLQHLYWLYLERGDQKTANHYFDLIEDEQYKIDAANLAGDAMGF